MTEPTLRQWLALEPPARAVALDGLLEALPEGFEPVPFRDAAVLPRFLHRATGVNFHLVFGDEVLVGASPARVKRALTSFRDRLPPADATAAMVPRRIVVPTLLVGEPLSAPQLLRLLVPESLVDDWGVRPAGLNATLKGLTREGWRSPSEVEWEYVARAAMDSLDDEPCPLQPAMRFLPTFGARFELCRDSWHPNWAGAPTDSRSWGDGHGVVRGGARWAEPAAWAECVWPSRRAQTGLSLLAIRPVRPWATPVGRKHLAF